MNIYHILIIAWSEPSLLDTAKIGSKLSQLIYFQTDASTLGSRLRQAKFGFVPKKFGFVPRLLLLFSTTWWLRSVFFNHPFLPVLPSPPNRNAKAGILKRRPAQKSSGKGNVRLVTENGLGPMRNVASPPARSPYRRAPSKGVIATYSIYSVTCQEGSRKPRSVNKGIETRDEVWILRGALTLSMHPGIPSVAQACRTCRVNDGSGLQKLRGQMLAIGICLAQPRPQRGYAGIENRNPKLEVPVSRTASFDFRISIFELERTRRRLSYEIQ